MISHCCCSISLLYKQTLSLTFHTSDTFRSLTSLVVPNITSQTPSARQNYEKIYAFCTFYIYVFVTSIFINKL